jgi:RNA polymerase sigma-70 factor (ECF subfamily)
MDLPAFTRLFDEHHAPLFRFAYRLTGSIADAEDIAQECFLELLRPANSYDPGRTPIRTYLFGIVRNQSLKRAPKRRIAPAGPVPATPADDLLRAELETQVARAIHRLPDTQREILILAHYEQLPLAEIAQIVDLELTAVKSRLQRARATLKESLAAYAPEKKR